jgi:N-acetylmuramoyl-L-alanine amidase
MRRDSLRLGIAIRDALRRGGPTGVAGYAGVNGIHRRSDLGGLNLSTVPKVFVEIGNMRADSDAAILVRAAARQQEAEAIAAGLARFLTGRRA